MFGKPANQSTNECDEQSTETSTRKGFRLVPPAKKVARLVPPFFQLPVDMLWLSMLAVKTQKHCVYSLLWHNPLYLYDEQSTYTSIRKEFLLAQAKKIARLVLPFFNFRYVYFDSPCLPSERKSIARIPYYDASPHIFATIGKTISISAFGSTLWIG